MVRRLLRSKKHQTITRGMVFEKGVENIQDSVHVVRIMFKESKSAERDRRGRRRIEPGEGDAASLLKNFSGHVLSGGLLLPYPDGSQA